MRGPRGCRDARRGSGGRSAHPRRRSHRDLAGRDRGRQGRGPVGPGVGHPLRRARRHRRHRVRLADRTRTADASAHRVRRSTGGSVPADRPAWLLAAAGRPRVDGAAADAQLRDDRDRQPGARRVPDRGLRDRPRRVRRGLPVGRHRRVRPGSCARHRDPGTGRTDAHASCSTRSGASATSCRSWAWTSSRCHPPYDHADITALLGNRVVLEALSAMARRRRDERDGTTWDPAQPLLEARIPGE